MRVLEAVLMGGDTLIDVSSDISEAVSPCIYAAMSVSSSVVVSIDFLIAETTR